MIRSGRRRRAAPPGLGWHRRLARRRRWHLALRRGSWGALAGAVVGVAASLAGLVPAWLPVVCFALGAAAGVAWPSGDPERWALDWLTRRAGLGYQTALEAAERDDPYGLWERSSERASWHLRDVEPPRDDPWWLPPLLVAALLLALPALPPLFSPSGAGSDTPGGEPDGPPPAVERDARGDPDAREREPEPARPEEAAGEPQRGAPEDQDEEDGDGASEEERAGADPGGREPAEGDEAGGPRGEDGEDAVSRALRNLRERPEDSPFRSAQGERQEADEPAPDEPGNRPLQQAGQADGAEDPEGERVPGDVDERSQREGGEGGGGEDPAAGEEEQDGEGRGADERAARPGDEREGDEGGGGAGEDRAAERAPGEADAQEGDDPQGLDPGAEAGGAAAGEREGAEDESSPGSPGMGAGERAGEEAPAGDPVGPAAGDPSFLQGELEEGEMAGAGQVRRPGAAPGALPEGERPETFRRAAERAVDEESLPTDYREIIRRYFE